MKHHILYPCVLAAFVAIRCFAADATLSYKDDSLGMNLAEFCAKYDHKAGGDPRRAPMLKFYQKDLSALPVVGPEITYRGSAKIVVEKNFPFERLGGKVPAYPETIAGVEAEVNYEFYAELLTDWDTMARWHRGLEDDFDAVLKGRKDRSWEQPAWRDSPSEVLEAATRIKLGAIVVSFALKDFDSVVAALTEKYGAPLQDTSDIVQDNSGTKFPRRRVRWIIAGSVIDVGALPTVDVASVHYYRPLIIEGAQRLSKHPSKDL